MFPRLDLDKRLFVSAIYRENTKEEENVHDLESKSWARAGVRHALSEDPRLLSHRPCVEGREES